MFHKIWCSENLRAEPSCADQRVQLVPECGGLSLGLLAS